MSNKRPSKRRRRNNTHLEDDDVVFSEMLTYEHETINTGRGEQTITRLVALHEEEKELPNETSGNECGNLDSSEGHYESILDHGVETPSEPPLRRGKVSTSLLPT